MLLVQFSDANTCEFSNAGALVLLLLYDFDGAGNLIVPLICEYKCIPKAGSWKILCYWNASVWKFEKEVFQL